MGTLFHCMEKHGAAARYDSMTLQLAPFEWGYFNFLAYHHSEIASVGEYTHMLCSIE